MGGPVPEEYYSPDLSDLTGFTETSINQVFITMCTADRYAGVYGRTSARGILLSRFVRPHWFHRDIYQSGVYNNVHRWSLCRCVWEDQCQRNTTLKICQTSLVSQRRPLAEVPLFRWTSVCPKQTALYGSLCWFVRLHLCLSVWLSICLLVEQTSIDRFGDETMVWNLHPWEMKSCPYISLSVWMFSICLYTRFSVYVSVSLSACLSIYLSICWSMSFYVYVCLSGHLSLCLYLSIHPCICLFVFLSTFLPTYLSVGLSVYLSIDPSVCLST